MYTIVFSAEELSAIVKLLDIACKAGGLQVAEACLIITKKCEQAKPVEEKKTDGGNE